MELQQSLFTDEELGGIPLEDVFEAYFECRKKKRNTCNALAFESDYERRCVELWREINAGTYRPSRSIAFIINKPVKREIFAADFRDRVVHHLIARRLVPLLEEKFINDSYSTRKGKRYALWHRTCGGTYPALFGKLHERVLHPENRHPFVLHENIEEAAV